MTLRIRKIVNWSKKNDEGLFISISLPSRDADKESCNYGNLWTAGALVLETLPQASQIWQETSQQMSILTSFFSGLQFSAEVSNNRNQPEARGQGVLILQFTESPFQRLEQGGEGHRREDAMCKQRVFYGRGGLPLPNAIWTSFLPKHWAVGLLVPVSSVSSTSCLEVADLLNLFYGILWSLVLGWKHSRLLSFQTMWWYLFLEWKTRFWVASKFKPGQANMCNGAGMKPRSLWLLCILPFQWS